MSDAPICPLIDAPDDGIIEERAWVPVERAETPEAAVDWCRRMLDYELDYFDDDGLELVATGQRSWHCVATCANCDGTGADEYSYPGDVPVRPFPACETCHGTGEQHDDAESILWETCKPDAEGAVEFWNLEVVDRRAQASQTGAGT